MSWAEPSLGFGKEKEEAKNQSGSGSKTEEKEKVEPVPNIVVNVPPLIPLEVFEALIPMPQTIGELPQLRDRLEVAKAKLGQVPPDMDLSPLEAQVKELHDKAEKVDSWGRERIAYELRQVEHQISEGQEKNAALQAQRAGIESEVADLSRLIQSRTSLQKAYDVWLTKTRCLVHDLNQASENLARKAKSDAESAASAASAAAANVKIRLKELEVEQVREATKAEKIKQDAETERLKERLASEKVVREAEGAKLQAEAGIILTYRREIDKRLRQIESEVEAKVEARESITLTAACAQFSSLTELKTAGVEYYKDLVFAACKMLGSGQSLNQVQAQFLAKDGQPLLSRGTLSSWRKLGAGQVMAAFEKELQRKGESPEFVASEAREQAEKESPVVP